MSLSLNIGSSTTIRDIYSNKNWINIDIVRPDKKPKGTYIRGSVLQLPFQDNSFEEIRAIHCLEHIDRKDHESFYKETHRVLKKDCSLFVEVPDFRQICKILTTLFDSNIDNKEERIRIGTLSVYGKGRHRGDHHRWGFYPELLVKDLSNYFSNVYIEKEMISKHYLFEPVILVRAVK